MKVIRPNCREHLTGKDVDFIVSVLAASAKEAGFLTQLLTDDESRDRVLDNNRLIDAIQDRAEHLSISGQLYFYLLVRHAFQHLGLDDRAVADYVAELLAEFSEAPHLACPVSLPNASPECVVDMLLAMQDRNAEERFAVSAHIGNYTLFMTGLYPERIAARRQHHGAPGLNYYETMGCRNYDLASRSPMAEKYGVSAVFQDLASAFHEVRIALNRMHEQFLFHSCPVPG
ncbi:MAG: hypothetical protein WCR06_08765 [bacterium]